MLRRNHWTVKLRLHVRLSADNTESSSRLVSRLDLKFQKMLWQGLHIYRSWSLPVYHPPHTKKNKAQARYLLSDLANIGFVTNKRRHKLCVSATSNLLTIQRTAKFWRDLQVVENIMIVFREQLNNFFTEKIKILSQCSVLSLDGLNFITNKSKLFTFFKNWFTKNIF